MGEYHDLYLKSDVLLLADVFENFRRASVLNYGLDPCHYISTPGLSWDAMLRMTGINLELITDIDQRSLLNGECVEESLILFTVMLELIIHTWNFIIQKMKKVI